MGAEGLAGIFGGGGYDAPEPIKYSPAPQKQDTDPEEKTIRDAEKRKLRARANGINGTLLKGSAPRLAAPTLLGG